MTLWNIIRDFFVQYVFGGTNSQDIFYSGSVGIFGSLYGDSSVFGMEFTDTLFVSVNNSIVGSSGSGLPTTAYISIGDWLSTTATIITLIGLFIGITMFIIKLVKWISNTIAMR